MPAAAKRPRSVLDTIPALPVLTLDALAAQHLGPRDALLPFLAGGDALLLHGPQGVGKTWLALTLARALTAGTPFLKWRAPAPVGVLLIDADTPPDALHQRLAALGGPPPAAPLQVCDLAEMRGYGLERIDFGDDDAHGLVYDHLAAHPAVRVVILDPLSSLFPLTPEGAREPWLRHMVRFLDCLRGERVAVVLVHHSARTGAARGAEARLDQLDTVLRLDRLRGATAAQGVAVSLTFTKCRHAFGPALEPIAATLRAAADGQVEWSWKPLEASAQERLLALARRAEGRLTWPEAMQGLGVARTTVFEIRRRLIATGDLADVPGFVPSGESASV